MTGSTLNPPHFCHNDCHNSEDVVEVAMLLPGRLIELLEKAASRRELTTAELLRHLIAGFVKSEERGQGQRSM